MAHIVIFNPQTQSGIQFLKNVSTPDYAGHANVDIDPDISQVSGPEKYWTRTSPGHYAMKSQGEIDSIDAAEAAALIIIKRSDAKALLSALDALGILERAFGDAVKDEINLLRERDRDRSVDVAAATNLADLKTRWAARAALNDRTWAQLKTVLENKMDSGSVDS